MGIRRLPRRTNQILLWVLPVILLAGCQGIELSPETPPGYNLTGIWELDTQSSDVTPDLKRGLKRRAGRNRTASQEIREELRGALGSGLAFIVHDFQVLNATRMEIEQNRDSMGVRYVPGIYRDITWGERQRGLWEVNAGWEEGDLVVLSKADGMQVLERMNLIGGNLLRITAIIEADGDEQVVTRIFRRSR